MEIAFNEFRYGFLSFFGSLGSRFSDFFSLENRFENTLIFSDIMRSESGIW